MLPPKSITYNRLKKLNIKFEIMGWEGKGNKRRNFIIGYDVYNKQGRIKRASLLMNQKKSKTFLYYPTYYSAQKTCDLLNSLLD